MSALIQSVAKPQGFSVLDLGAGQGYLSRALALHYNLQVLGVDMSEIQTRGAQKFDAKALYKSAMQPRLDHITQRVTPENVDSILQQRDPLGNHWLVCGLHTCGDLGSTTMRLFAKSDQVQALVHVGCCYHYLTESESPDRGFPMSNHVDGCRLGTTARVLACQSPSRWIDQPKASMDTFEQHFFRAMFQDLLVRKGLAEHSAPTVLGKLNKQKQFDGFVKKALERLEMPADAISSEEAVLYEQQCRDNRLNKKLIVLWTLRALMGPILESLVLTDRYLYLSQSSSSQVWMWPLFSPAQSPRNVVFVALKSTQSHQES
ncbi:methyltransferase domain-containing protein [Phycomyces nitens]|nr:methyltransferase domain-containing protein [Phycomyces nitens]